MNYKIKATHRQSARSHYAYNDHAFSKDMADSIVKANRIIHPDHIFVAVPEDSLSGISTPTGPEPMKPLFTAIELHLSAHDTSWTRKFGLRVKRAGGEYSDIRGSKSNRYVTIPIHALEAEELIADIIAHEIDRTAKIGMEKRRNSVTMIARGIEVDGYEAHAIPAWVSVHHYSQVVHESAEVDPAKWLVAMVWVSVAQAIVTNSLLKKLEPTPSAPMVTVEPPTPVTALARAARALGKVNKAINWMKESNIHHTPMWSDLQDARMELEAAISKLS